MNRLTKTFSKLSLNVNVFFKDSQRKNNDKNNKIRENIIALLINEKEKYSNTELSNNLNSVINNLTKEYKYDNLRLEHKGGRKFNYDFDLKLTKESETIKTFKLEFKYNKIPQFVSPMNLSKYFKNSYEEYFYENKLKKIFDYYDLEMPNKQTYLKEIQNNKPKCTSTIQEKYYNGCKNSSKFLNSSRDIEFYKLCNKLSNESIKEFINNNELNYELLEKYLIDTQKDKIYLIFSDGKFQIKKNNLDEYKIIKCVKNVKYNRFDCFTVNGIIKVLIRWKNGNGIAFPALQISYIENRKNI